MATSNSALQWRRFTAGTGGLFLLLAVLLLVFDGQPCAGGVTDAVLRERQAELIALRARVEERRERIAELRAEGQDLEKILAELERQRALVERYIKTLGTQVVAIENDLAGRRVRLGRQEAALRVTRQGLGNMLQDYYKHGRVEAAELLISSATFGEIFARTHYWIRVLRKLRDQVLDAEQQNTLVRRELSVFEGRRRTVLALQREREVQLATLERDEAARRNDRAELRRTVAHYEEQTRLLLASQVEIEKRIAAAERSAAGAAGPGLKRLKGKLPWPVAGRVTTRFGTHIHPKYGTRVKQQGIEIAAAEGTPIKAVAAGRVVFEGWFAGYGKTVILDHGEGTYSLYAHASEIHVRQGDGVGGGQVIARVGSTDSLKGPGLHFEIREGREARDPTRWLKRK